MRDYNILSINIIEYHLSTNDHEIIFYQLFVTS